MFNEDRSDFAAPIVAFLYIGFVLATIGLEAITSAGDFTDYKYVAIFDVIGILGFIIAGINLYKAYILEGVSIGLVALLAYASATVLSFPLAFGLAALFVFAGVICYLNGVLDLTIINGLSAIVSIVAIGFKCSNVAFVLVGLIALGAAGVALYVAYFDWTFAQEILESYEDEFCCCGDDCDCEECNCEECNCEECNCEECNNEEHPEGCTCEKCENKQ